MNPPVCRLCSASHWPREPHIFKTQVVEAVRGEATKTWTLLPTVPVTHSVTHTEDAVTHNAEKQKRWRAAHPEYKARNRERMALLRAQKKSEAV